MKKEASKSIQKNKLHIPFRGVKKYQRAQPKNNYFANVFMSCNFLVIRHYSFFYIIIHTSKKTFTITHRTLFLHPTSRHKEKDYQLFMRPWPNEARRSSKVVGKIDAFSISLATADPGPDGTSSGVTFTGVHRRVDAC